MNKAFLGGVVISIEADLVARELILEYQIPRLHNLAFILNINKCFDDHQALRLWVQKLYEENCIHKNDLLNEARKRLIENFQ